MKISAFIIFILIPFFSVFGQQSSVRVQFLYDGELISLNSNYFLSSIKDSISFDALKCYLSQVSITDVKGKNQVLDKKHVLLDLENLNSCVLILPKESHISSIQFNVGVDSTSNSKAMMQGDLDPINGMYWAWQSGFINWKIEGKCNSLTTRNHVFQYHIGGFLAPFQSTRFITLKNLNPSKKISVCIDLKQFLDQANLFETNEVMSPSAKSVEFSSLFSSLFYLKNE